MSNVSRRRTNASLLSAADFWHVDPRSTQTPPRFKEWSHFSVLGSDFDLLVNFSLVRREQPDPITIPRLIVLFRDAEGTWDGDIEMFGANETSILAGAPDAVMGRSSVRSTNVGYRLDVALSKRDVNALVDLVPVVRPLVADNVRLSGADSFRWMVAPHLRAHGEAAVSGRRYPIVDAPAYHDRNSGCFEWGGAFSWEWATILPSAAGQPWSLVYSRIGSRNRGAAFSQSLLIWRGATLVRKFYGRDLSISHEGLLGQERGLCLPRIASLVVPGAADVPREILVSAKGYGDEVTLRISFSDFAQIAVPKDRWPGFTRLFEIKGHAEMTGRIGAERIAFEGRAQAELNHVV